MTLLTVLVIYLLKICLILHMQGSQNVPAISPFTFTFLSVKNLSSMGFPTIFMFM